MKPSCKLLFALALLASVAAAESVKTVGIYSGKYAVSANGYVLKLPTDFSEEAILNNAFRIRIIPQITIDGEPFDSNFEVDEAELLKPAGSHTFEKKTIESSVTIMEKAILEEKTIAAELTFRNNGAVKTTIKIYQDFFMEKSSLLFSTTGKDQKPVNFFTILPPALEGQALAIIFNQNIEPAFENLEETDFYTLELEFPLAAGAQYTLRIEYKPFYATLNEPKAYPLDLSSHAAEPLVKTSGTPSTTISSQETAKDKITQLAAKTYKTAGDSSSGLFKELHDSDISNPTDSLVTSLVFKQACKQNDLACRLIIGKKNDSYYAWVQAYSDKWQDIDSWASLEQKPDYETIYVEPTIEARPFQTGDKLEAAYLGVQWVKSGFEIPGPALFIAFIVAALIILQWKVGLITTALQIKPRPQLRTTIPTDGPATPSAPATTPSAPAIPLPTGLADKTMPSTPAKPAILPKPAAPAKPAAPIRRQDLDGTYDILKEEVSDYLSKEVLKQIKQREGRVVIEEYAGALGFSKELIEYSLKFLIEQGHITKKPYT